MRRPNVVPAVMVSALLVGSVGMTSPALAALPADAPSDRTLDRMAGALVRADDLPRRLGTVDAGSIGTGTGHEEQPDVCPTSREQELDDAEGWAATSFDNRHRVSVESRIWVYDSRSAVRRSPRSALNSVIDCVNESKRVNGRTITQEGERTSSRAASQTLIIRSKSKPRRIAVASSWRIDGRYLVLVSIKRFGKDAAERRDLDIADDLARDSVRRLDGPVRPLETTAPQQATLPFEDARPVGGLSSRWVVSLGDSYISGEGGAWKGNVENSLNDGAVFRGKRTYYDNTDRTGETITNCHRSDSAAIHIGSLQSLNLACSGATASSKVDANGDWKPGIDFATEPGGTRRGQAAMLQEFASNNKVRMVALSIGGNDFGFADIIEQCVKDFLFSPYLWSTYCSEDSSVTKRVNDEAVEEVTTRISRSISNVGFAMKNAGYSPDEWRLVVHNYPSPLPRGSGFRYWQTILRQSDGGCGFWNRDADWADSTVLPQVNRAVAKAVAGAEGNVLALDLSRAFVGNRLCEEGTVSVDTLPGLATSTTAKEFQYREWVMQIRAVSDNYSSADKQESFHPNYYGQLAIRNCLRQVYEQNRGGQCVRKDRTVTERGEPNMALR